MGNHYGKKSLCLTLSFALLFSQPALAEEIIAEEIAVLQEDEIDAEASGGGYISMPWDREVSMPDERISYSDFRKRMVDGDSEISDYEPREEIPAAFPYAWENGGGEDVIAQYLVDNYPACRDQGDFGTCWAHGTMASAEFYAVNKLGYDKDIDLSELYLADFIYEQRDNPVAGSKEGTYIKFGSNDFDKLAGGNYWLASQYLSKGFGYIDEEDLPNVTSSEDSRFDEDKCLNLDYSDYAGKKHFVFQNSYVADSSTDNGKAFIKEAIMQNGIACISFYANSAYYNDSYKSFYNYEKESSNHAVTIVGWDDDFPAGNFSVKAPSDGAWLVRNSWGSEENNTFHYWNYFWLSYYDKGITTNVAAFIYDIAEAGHYYDKNYYYDSQIHNTSYFPDAEPAANIYKVSGESNELLKEVNIEITYPASYKIDIYTDLQDESNPESGKHISSATTTGSLLLEGIYTIPLKKEVFLKKDSKFAVVVTLDNRTAALETDFNYWKNLEVDCGIYKGQSFLKFSGKWTDLYDLKNSSTENSMINNFCISARTVYTGDETIPVTSNGSIINIIRDSDYGSYKTEDGKDVLVFSFAEGESAAEPAYQFSSKKIIPGKKGFVVYEGEIYEYKKDFTIKAKKNRKLGEASVTVKWKKHTSAYKKEKKSTMNFKIVERSVNKNMLSYERKSNGEIKKLRIKADGITMKPKKKDYEIIKIDNTDYFNFKNNYKGQVAIE